MDLGLDPAWPGYTGAPHRATAADGAEQSRRLALYCRELVPRILDGTLEPRELPRLRDFFSKAVAAKSPTYQRLMKEFYEHERAQGERQQKWLAAREQK